MFRRDDGPEFRSWEFQRVIRKWRIREEVIPPGQPFNNGHIESYQGTMREELLDREEFDSLEEAQQKIYHWVSMYNTERYHSALGYRTLWRSGMTTIATDIIDVSNFGYNAAMFLITPVSLLGAY